MIGRTGLQPAGRSATTSAHHRWVPTSHVGTYGREETLRPRFQKGKFTLKGNLTLNIIKDEFINPRF